MFWLGFILGFICGAVISITAIIVISCTVNSGRISMLEEKGRIGLKEKEQ